MRWSFRRPKYPARRDPDHVRECAQLALRMMHDVDVGIVIPSDMLSCLVRHSAALSARERDDLLDFIRADAAELSQQLLEADR